MNMGMMNMMKMNPFGKGSSKEDDDIEEGKGE